MNITHITVEYPTLQHTVVKTLAEAKAMGYKSAIIRKVPVNRPQNIVVKQVKRLVQEEFMDSTDYDKELDAKCVAETGMTRAAYQVRYKRSWNE